MKDLPVYLFVLFAIFGCGEGKQNEGASDNAKARQKEEISIAPAVKPEKYVKELAVYSPEVVVVNKLVTYFDFEEALGASKILKKPVLVCFDGINCVNCRRMEKQVWSDREVMRRLKEDFVVVTLYCDADRVELPKEEQFYSKVLKHRVLTLGEKIQDLQITKYGSNTQPSYYCVDDKGTRLDNAHRGYDADVQGYIAYLDGLKQRYSKRYLK